MSLLVASFRFSNIQIYKNRHFMHTHSLHHSNQSATALIAFTGSGLHFNGFCTAPAILPSALSDPHRSASTVRMSPSQRELFPGLSKAFFLRTLRRLVNLITTFVLAMFLACALTTDHFYPMLRLKGFPLSRIIPSITSASQKILMPL